MNASQCNNISASEFDTFSDIQYYVRGIAILILSIIGIILNISVIYIIFPKKDEKNLFNMIIVNLFTWDAVFLFTQAMISSIIYIHCPWSYNNIVNDVDGAIVLKFVRLYRKGLRPFRNISLSHSIFLTAALSVERYISLIHPNAHKWLTGQAVSRLVICFL